MKGRLNSTSAPAAVLALALFAPGAVLAQDAMLGPVAPASTSVCVATEDGVPIPLGTEVKDQAGQTVGSVSIGQCSENPGPGKVRVALQLNGDFRVRIVSLRGAQMDQGQLKLAANAQDVLALAPATEASLVDAAARAPDVPTAQVSPPRPAAPRTGASSIRR